MDVPQHVLVGYDGSPLSELALHRAFRMVEHSAFALIHVVAVVDDGVSDYVRLPTGQLMSRWAALDSVRLMVAGVTQELREQFPQVRLIAHVRTGEPAQALVDFAYRYHIDQIILGARGQNSSSQSSLGSIASKILSLTEIATHIEGPIYSLPPLSTAHPLRWAYISDKNSSPSRSSNRAKGFSLS